MLLVVPRFAFQAITYIFFTSTTDYLYSLPWGVQKRHKKPHETWLTCAKWQKCLDTNRLIKHIFFVLLRCSSWCWWYCQYYYKLIIWKKCIFLKFGLFGKLRTRLSKRKLAKISDLTNRLNRILRIQKILFFLTSTRIIYCTIFPFVALCFI